MKFASFFFCLSLTAVAEPAPLETASAEMAEAAKAFLASLDEGQAQKARYPFQDEERENWNFVPIARKGISLKELTPPQRDLARKLLTSGMSRAGTAKIDTIIALEGFLRELENRPDYRDPEKYYTTLFGDPSADGTWGWRFEGHHLAVNFTIIEGKAISATPSFMGANRAHVKEGRLAGTRALAKEEDLARALAVTLKEAGKPVHYSEKPPAEILTGADRKAKQLEPVGVAVAECSESQTEGLLELISEYANRHRREIAEKDLAKIKGDLANVRFGWAGSLAPGEAYYYRIQGKTFLIEVANIQNDANHIHTVWRDLEGDFGRDELGDHMHDHDHNH